MGAGIDQRLLDQMSEHILEARHEDVAADFCRLVREGASPLEVEYEGLRTASPFLNVPAHIMVKPDHEVRSVNYDHTLLGIWRSLRLSKMMPKGYEDLPIAQAMWYLPQGLDIWSQLLCEFPGHYATDQEKCPRINLQGPKQHFEEYPPLVEGGFDERLGVLFQSIVQGDKALAFRTFLGLANEAQGDDAQRTRLEAQVLFAGIVDLPGPRLTTGLLVNPSHKAIRARAMIDLANTLGWDRAYPAFLVVIPDLAANPRFQDMLDFTTLHLRGAFGADYHRLRHNTGAMAPDEMEAFIAMMYDAPCEELMSYVTGLLQRGTSLVTMNDVALVAISRLMARIEHPVGSAGFFQTGHCFDYANVVGYWLRRYDHEHQAKAAYFVPHFVNDTARYLRVRAPKDPAQMLDRQPADYAAHAEGLSLRETIAELAAACDVQDTALAGALTDSYLARTDDRQALVDTLAFGAARFESDPHIARNAMSHHEEYLHSTLPPPMRDQLFRSWTRYLSRSKKRSDAFNCVAVYEDVLGR